MSHDARRRAFLGELMGDTACRATPVPNVVVTTHEGRRALFHDDLARGKVLVVQFVSLAGEKDYPVLANVARVAALLGDRLGRDVHLCTITTDPANDTPRALAEAARRHGARPGWWFLTGEATALAALKSHFFHGGHAHDGSEDCSRGTLRYGNAAAGLWGSAPARAEPEGIVERLSWLVTRATPTTAPRRRGPAALAALCLALLSAPASRAEGTAQDRHSGHPYPQPYIAASTQTTVGEVTTVVTGGSLFDASTPFVDPPGTNLLPTVYTNLFDSNGEEMPNTLPSTPTVPYNLHDGVPVVTTIDRASPTSDLAAALDRIDAVARGERRGRDDEDAARHAIDRAIDILEGNPVENRAYSGFPVLHYTGPTKLKKVQPIHDASGKVIGGNVDVHQIWYDSRIESDTAMLDPTEVQGVPWTITYTIDVLERGRDDFSPFAFYDDAPADDKPGGFGRPNVGMDQTFFPMDEGTRTVVKVKMAPGKYWSLTYTWGWRWHAPRAQVIENRLKKIDDKDLYRWEADVFGENPRENEAAKRKAIEKIGDRAPAKILWRVLHDARNVARKHEWKAVQRLVGEARIAFDDWKDRLRLPRGVPVDTNADLTLFYANNTIHGQFTDGATYTYAKFQSRGTPVKITLINGDYFDHRYMNVDFGGARGWENQFKSSVRVGGSGCWFTFGRAYINVNVAQPVRVPAATQRHGGDVFGRHRVHLTINADPSRRLRFYQFDPTHHDVSIFSIH